jgi:FtsP/CotA-like multicopper oxidase with cupredoxin domain
VSKTNVETISAIIVLVILISFSFSSTTTTSLAAALFTAKGGFGNTDQNLTAQINALKFALTQKLQQQQQIQSIAAAKLKAEQSALIQKVNVGKNCATDQHTETTYITYLVHFACGHISVMSNGTVLRKFTLITNDYNGTGKPIPISTNKEDLVTTGQHYAKINQTNDPVIFHGWTFNGTIPGPTIRVTQGDHVQVTVINSKDSAFDHSWHVHSIHSGVNDGTMTASGLIPPGGNYTYIFTAMPAGVYPYHCHMAPVEEHISRGLYGMMIIDPPTPRPHAIELVGMLNSYSFSYMGLDGKGHFTPTVPATMADMRKNLTAVEEASDETNGPDNQFYSINGMPFGYTGPNELPISTHTNYRMYLVNMVEFDPVNSFHLHGNMFNFTESGTLSSPKILTDIVTLSQGDRGIVEFNYPYPGVYMMHAHINHFTDLGWIGFFNATNSKNSPVTSKLTNSVNSPTMSKLDAAKTIDNKQ